MILATVFKQVFTQKTSIRHNLRRREILKHWCQDMEIPFLALGTKEEFGKLLNKKPLGLLAITDARLAEAICQAAESYGGD